MMLYGRRTSHFALRPDAYFVAKVAGFENAPETGEGHWAARGLPK